ncbi:T9SS type A sorting domain-containing protein [Lacinutrix iliipiscaria]|uniref:T9SS type A sorting domain-containing protein n=1 Tax=Lacinutrix iliipiscaria TaxID=1230532 RepID=A0ABW5WL57_9FLAO
MIKKFSLLLIAFLSAIAFGFAQTTIAVQDFDGATPTWGYAISPATYNISSDYWAIRSTNNAPTGTSGDFWAIRDLNNPNGGGSFDHTLTLNNVNVSGYTNVTTSFRYYTIGFDGPDYLRYQIAYNGGAFGAPVDLLKNTGAWTTVTINAPIGTTSVSLRMIGFQDGGSDYAGWDDFEIEGISSSPTPTITASPTSITGLDYVFPGGPSAAQSYSLSATDLTPAAGNITVTAPANFSISKTLGGTYTNSLTYAYTGGSLAASDVFVRLNAGLPIGTYGPSNITNAGGGATTQNVAVTGNVTAGGSGASDIVSVPGSESALISSLSNDTSPLTSTEGVQVWQFRVRDGGAGLNDADILPTILTDLTITQYTGNQVTTWSDAIESVDLFNGSTWIATGVVSASQIQFSGLSGADVTVGDDTQRTFSLRLSLKCPLGPDAFDGEDFVFGITNANVNFSGAGSGKSSFATQFSTNGQNVIDVLATELVFTVQPSNTGLNSTMTDVIVTVADICGNPNTNFTGPVTLTSTGTMTGTPTVNAVAGVATFTNIIVHTAIGTGFTLTASAGFGITSQISTPFDITPVTVLDPGDLAILAVNTNLGSGRDQIAFVIFRDITAGTRIYLTDNGYERRYAGEWGGTEGVISITRNGPDLDAGTIIVIESTTANVTNGSHFDVYTCGGIDTNWTKDAVSGASVGGFNLNANDDVWIMQGGIWSNDTAQHSTYTGGNVLYGWTESGWDAAPGGPTGSTTRSTIYPGLECFNTVAPTGPGYVKFNDPDVVDFSSITNARLDWISLINTTANWDTYTSSAAYVAGGYDYKGNVTCPALTIATNTYIDGKWTGNADENWFNCSNWDTLEVPDETVDVIVSDNSFDHGAIIDATNPFASNYGSVARAHNLTIEGEKVEIVNSATSNILEVHGDLLIDDPVGVNEGFLDMNTANADDKIFLYGNWTNNVGASGFDEGNGTVEFTGTTDQIITGGIPIPAIPEEFYNVILNNDFDTNISNDLYLNGNLTINGGRTLTVADGGYVYVNFDVTNYGDFNINNNGSLVQGDDSGTNIGNISMERIASIRRQDYVYWSSPISNYTVNNISPSTPTNLIFRWNPTIANPAGGQGNWVPANGETMLAGVGYILRGPNGMSTTIHNNHTATFNGGVPFNGVVTRTVSRGSLLGIDDNWNLLGNPYPSAIDAYTFLNDPTNSNLDGFVNLWTHGTLPNTGIGDPFYDDFYSNYTAADYIAYNGMGMSSGIGDVSIGAGQSFMVNVAETAGNYAANSYTVEFNNSMRGIGPNYDNSQFYKIASKKSTTERTGFIGERHRIWLDLISESQGTNRILVGYAENATMGRDRLYDAIADVQNSQGFYSTIDGLGFTIQGRALPFLQTDIIPLGVQLVESGSYHIAIGAIDGLFETENQDIYLKDNALGFTHNLTASPYSFSAEAGVINDRFELVFTTQSLSVDEYELNNALTIIELQDGRVKFSVSNNLEIKNVKLYDTLGRLLYDLEGHSNTEVYNLSHLSQATYIAQVTLSNDVVVTKKAVKRN